MSPNHFSAPQHPSEFVVRDAERRRLGTAEDTMVIRHKGVEVAHWPFLLVWFEGSGA